MRRRPACYDLRRNNEREHSVHQYVPRHLSAEYRPDVDGLRAVAVLSVILCHAGIGLFTGGFVGVDVFFTISGFVVATSILGDIERRSFSFGAFYARRAKRLAPSLFVVLSAAFIYSVLFSFPDDTYHLAKNILAIATMTSNIFLSKQTGYFDATAADQPLLHTWSLSVEEQFYLILPVVLYFVSSRAPRHLVKILIILTIGSFISAVLVANSASRGVYYFSQYRGFEFLFGVLLAKFEYGRKIVKRERFDFVFAIGLIMVLYSSVNGNVKQFPGIGALMPCVGAVLLIFAGRRCRFSHVLLSNKLFVSIGRISYPMYLWHWPLFFALRKFDLTSNAAYVAAIATTIVLAALTYIFVEKPVRRRTIPVRQALLCFLGLPVVASASLAATGRVTDGFLFAYPEKVQDDFKWSGDSLFDMPRGKRCWSQVGVSNEAECFVGVKGAKTKAVLWGDSHAYHLIYFFDELGKSRNISIHDVGFTLCPPIEGMPRKPGDSAYQADHEKCVQHDTRVMNFIMRRPDVNIVFMAAAWQNYQNLSGANVPNGHGFLPNQLENELGSTISKLSMAGKHVVLMDDVPMIPQGLINCAFNNNLYFPVRRRVCEFDVNIAKEQHAPVEAMLTRLKQRFPGIDVMHTYDVPCNETVCTLTFDGRPIYRFDDYHHLSVAGSSLLFPRYMTRHPDELDRILARAGS
ncbi:acyltransferase 3 [Burkholderia pseudomallei]|nr:acyltransferase 3 [Burkholderia pseudomallei]CAJ6690234.1 acyltransferase 3 [Burkholderia pseudomallei]